MENLPAGIRAALEHDLTIDITTIGRKTGEPRQIEIWFLNVDGAVYITGTPGKRDWYANLLSEPRFTFHLKESLRAELQAFATVVDDLEQRRRVFESADAHWYRANDDGGEMIATAPMIRVTFPEQAAPSF